MLAGLRKLIKGALFDSKGSLSLSRCVLLFVVAEVTAITWLAVLWCHYVTVNGLMVEAAPLAQAVSTGAAAVLSSQVAAAAFQYFTQAKFSGGGVSGRQLDLDEVRTEILAGEAPTPVPDVGYLVPSDESEPRVMAETYQIPGTQEIVTTGTVLGDLAEPVDVNIVGDETGEKK